MGSEEAAFQAMDAAVQSQLQAGELTTDARNLFETVVNIGGQDVTVTGAVVDGVARISTAFR